MKDIMLDIETMGTRATSMIVQIGACYFDRVTGEIGDTFKVNINHSEKPDRFTVDWHTIAWWLQQSPEAQASITDGEELNMKEALTLLNEFIKPSRCLWSHATFDVPVLLNAYNVCNLHFPIHYTKMRDIRTLMDIKDHNKGTAPREGTHHDALDDCIYQVGYCVEALNKK